MAEAACVITPKRHAPEGINAEKLIELSPGHGTLLETEVFKYMHSLFEMVPS
jgi:hypothetical protein